MHPSPSQCSKDAPMVMPTRRGSITRILPVFTKPLVKVLSALDLSNRTQGSSLECLDGVVPEDGMPLSRSFCLSNRSLSLRNNNTVVIEADGSHEEKSVYFASTPVSSTKIGLCLGDYTMEEIEACWYCHDEIRYMQEKRRRKNKRKIFKKKSKRLQRKVLKREDDRWSS